MKMKYKDFTIKARLNNRNETEQVVKNLNAMYIGLDIQTDQYFKVNVGKLKYRVGSIGNLITHYERVEEWGAEKTTVYRYDLDPSTEQIQELFSQYEKLGLTKKERVIYALDNILIHFDKLTTGEEFIEIEAMDKEDHFSLEELKAQCQLMKDSLELPDDAFIKTGYLENRNPVL